jgi:hypothetical protein
MTEFQRSNQQAMLPKVCITGVDGNTGSHLHSAGFHANFLLYPPQAQNDGMLPIPVGKGHKFAPVALGVSTSLQLDVNPR